MHKIFAKEKIIQLKRISNINQRNVPRQKKYPVLREDTGVALASKSSVLKSKREKLVKKLK